MIVILGWCRINGSSSRLPWKIYQTTVFNTPCVIKLQGDSAECSAAARAIIGRLFALHNCLNRFDSTSPVAQFNASPCQKPFECPPLLWNAILEARRAYTITDGAFDITILPLLDFWKLHPDGQKSSTELEEFAIAKTKVGFNKLLIDEEKHTIAKTIEGQKIDFGGLAKGLALDIACEELSAHNLSSFIIDLGGNLYLSKDIQESLIATPDHSGKFLCTLQQVGGRFIATSSNGERAITPGKVGHIINPMTGASMQPAWSVTSVTAKGVDSDIFSTAVFVGGASLAQKLSESVPESGFVIYHLPAGTPPIIIGKINHQK